MYRKTRAQPKVLVVDDEPDIRELLELTLSPRWGWLRWTRAGSLEEARRFLQEANPTSSASPTCGCPTARGWSLVAPIISPGLGGDLPVAVITAYGSAD